MKETIQYGSREIIFDLELSNRKSLGISISPKLEVSVKAPFDTAIDLIKNKIKKRAPWIIRQQNFFLFFYPKMSDRIYVSGETHLYLGRQ